MGVLVLGSYIYLIPQLPNWGPDYEGWEEEYENEGMDVPSFAQDGYDPSLNTKIAYASNILYDGLFLFTLIIGLIMLGSLALPFAALRQIRLVTGIVFFLAAVAMYILVHTFYIPIG
jgi:fatty-acid desaturase